MGYDYKAPEIEIIKFHAQDVMSASQITTTESEWTHYY